jgi:hypothetical protein
MESLDIRSILYYAVTCLVFQFISPYVAQAEFTVFKHEFTIIEIYGEPIPWLPAVGETLDARITISHEGLGCWPSEEGCAKCIAGSCDFRIRLRTVDKRKVDGAGLWNGPIGSYACGITKMSGVLFVPDFTTFFIIHAEFWDYGCQAVCEGPDLSFCCIGEAQGLITFYQGPGPEEVVYSVRGPVKSDDEDCDQ